MSGRAAVGGSQSGTARRLQSPTGAATRQRAGAAAAGPARRATPSDAGRRRADIAANVSFRATLWWLVGLGLAGAQCPHESADLLAWEDTATWPSGNVPVAGDDVTISGPVVLSSATAPLGAVTIPTGGRLVFAPVADRVVKLSAELVELTGGQLWIGAEDCPYEERADVELLGQRDESPEAPSVQKAILVRSGMLEIHGKPKLTWTRLAATLPKTLRGSGGSSPIHDMKDTNNLDKIGFQMAEFNADGSLLRYWGRVFGPTKLSRVSMHTGKIVVMAVTGKALFGEHNIADQASLFESVCYGGGRQSAMRDMSQDEIVAWVAVCVIGSPELSTERLGSSHGWHLDTQRLVHTVGSIDVVVQSMVRIEGDPRVLTEMLTYPTGGVPSLDVIVPLLSEVSSWETGDWIALASTDYDVRQSEEFQLLDCPECDASAVKISGPVLYTHWGEITDGIDMRGEIGMMTRNVRIYGAMEESCYGSNLCNLIDFDSFGGQIKMLQGFESARVENAEFFHMGQQSVIGSYPLHFHMCLDVSSKPAYIRGNSIHSTFSRCTTVHGTHNLTLEDNFAYNHFGHCFFLEDGGEQHNRLIGNLGFGTYAGSLIPTDRTGKVSTFWITNPDNEILNNVAAGSRGMGFWILMPEYPTGPSASVDMGLISGQSKHTIVRAFTGNVAHSNPAFGFRLDDKLLPDGTTEPIGYAPLVDPTDPRSEMLHMHLDDFTGYKNGESVWIKSIYTLVTNYRIADSQIGIIFASAKPGRTNQHREILQNSRIVGESGNKGEPAVVRLADGTSVQLDRSVEVMGSPLRARVGVAFYRGPVHVWNTTFANFQDNVVRQAGAIGKKPKNPYLSSPIAGIRNAVFEFTDPSGGSRFYDGDGGEEGYEELDGNRHNVILDIDGSLTTYPGASLIRPIPVLMNARCVVLPNWGPGTALCPDRFTRLELKNVPRPHGTFLTRNDLQGDVVEAALATQQISYSLNTAESYIFHFNTTVPQKFVLQPYGLQQNLYQLVGVCIGVGSQFEIKPRMFYSAAATLDDLKADDTGRKYYYDSPKGVLMFRFTNPNPRLAETTSHCPGNLDAEGNGICDMGPKIILTASNEDGDCRGRAYPDYYTPPVSSEGALVVPTFG